MRMKMQMKMKMPSRDGREENGMQKGVGRAAPRKRGRRYSVAPSRLATNLGHCGNLASSRFFGINI